MKKPQQSKWQKAISALNEAFDAHFRVTVLSNVTESRLEAVVQPVSDGKNRLIIPIGEEEGQAVVAIGTLEATPRQIQAGLLKLAVRLVHEAYQCEEQRLDLTACTHQLGQDFEELNWLRGQLLSFKDGLDTESVEEMARTLLRPMLTIIQAEGIVLVSADQANTPEGQEVPLVGREVLRVGSEKMAVKEESCRQLVIPLREVARARPLVQNDVNLRREFSTVTGIHSCILAPVTRRETFFGWMLAVNRVAGTAGADTTTKDAAWHVSEDEFGSVEAGLMESAAAILAIHHRGPELWRGEAAAPETVLAD